MILSPTALFLIALIVVTAALTASSIFADWWSRRNIPLPEDFHKGAEGETAMIAEFERIRKIHAARRRQSKEIAKLRPTGFTKRLDTDDFDSAA